MLEPGKDGNKPLKIGINVNIKTALKRVVIMPEKDFTRPWGGLIKFINNKPCTIKILQIKQEEILSLQSHKLRNELWYIIPGKVKVFMGKDVE